MACKICWHIAAGLAIPPGPGVSLAELQAEGGLSFSSTLEPNGPVIQGPESRSVGAVAELLTPGRRGQALCPNGDGSIQRRAGGRPSSVAGSGWRAGSWLRARHRAGCRAGMAGSGPAGEQVLVCAEVHGGCGAGGELSCISSARAGVGPLASQDPGQRYGKGGRVVGGDEDAAAVAQGARQAIDRRSDDRDAEAERHDGALRPGLLP
jgi:hypothetical protein